MRYGFVGLGTLGAKLAANLLAGGIALKVYDLNTVAVAKAEALGAVAATSVADAASGVDALITCLPSPAASEAVVAGPHGAFAHMNSGATWIEMSTLGVEDIKRLSALAEEHGVKTLEAPLTGGVHRAVSGEMTILAGGDEEVLSAHHPALELMSAQIVHMGPIGSASLIKVISNMLCLIDLVAAGEALSLAKAGGLDLGKAYEAITASSGNSREFEDWAPVILNGSLNTGFTLDLGLKDLGFVSDLGRAHDVPLKLSTLVEQLFHEARAKYGGSAWTPHVVKIMEEETGLKLRTEGFADVIPKD
ncbi:MAG: NAD(P)-dependent oxidoreductase [Pseudomonadota bacterium]